MLAATGTAHAQYTWTQWTTASGGNGKWYALTTGAVEFQDYVTEAVSAGGYATSVQSAAENAFLFGTFTTGAVNTPALWIGFARVGTNYADPCAGGPTPFAWVNGDPILYTNWNPGEPNFSSCDNIALFNNNAAAGWNDVPTVSGAFGTIRAQGIIRRDTDPNAPVTSTPEPGALALVATGLLAVVPLARRRR